MSPVQIRSESLSHCLMAARHADGFALAGFCCMIVSVAMMKLFIVIDNRIVEAWLRSSVVERLPVEEDVAGSSPVGVALLRIFWELVLLS